MFAQSARSIMWLGVLLDASVKGVLVLGAAGVLTLALRRASAALRHLVWSLAMVSLLILPALSAILPSWQVPILVYQVVPGVEPAAPVHAPAEPPPDRTVAPSPPPSVLVHTDHPKVYTSVPEARGARVLPHWSEWILLLWVVGANAALAPVLLGMVNVWRRARRAEGIADGVWAAILPALGNELGLGRTVTLLESDRAAIPTTWGVLRPIVLLPSEARDWPTERCRIVLLHELAHIRRCDWLTQIVARFTCALYWFNPLVWLAARRIRVESEQSCDDSVLRAGHTASGYAGQLLDIVCTMRPTACESLATVPLGRQSRIQKRLTAILDANRNRQRLTRAAVTLAVVGIGGIVVPVAAIRPVVKEARADEAQETERRAAATADDPAPRERRLSFPDDWSIGMVRARDIGATDLYSEWWSEQYPGWDFHAAAEGSVTVPAGKEVALLINCSGSEDFRPLAKLRPGDVDSVLIECSGESSSYMESLSTLAWLDTLILRQKNIDNEDLRWLKSMSSLRRLSIFATHLNDDGLAHVGQLTSLKSLRISGEDFTDAGLADLSNLVSLEEMFLGRRDVLGDGLAHLAKLPRLERLGVYAVTVSGVGAAHLGTSTSLKELKFNKSDLTPEDLGHIAAIPNLETLQIHRMITDDGVVRLSTSRSLKELVLGMDFQDSRDLITDVALASLSKVSSLESVGLYYGKFTDEGLEHLSGLPNLKSLAIPNCRAFTDVGLENLSELSRLEQLDLRRGRFSDTGLKRFKEALPNCSMEAETNS